MEQTKIVESAGTQFGAAESDGEWFSFFESRINERGEIVYDEPKPGAGRARIRSLTPFFEARAKARKKRFDWVLNTATRGMERVGFYDEPTAEEVEQERDDLRDFAITGLENFKIGEKTVPCTKEGKLALFKYPVFDRFVARCQALLSSSGVKAKEEEQKN